MKYSVTLFAFLLAGLVCSAQVHEYLNEKPPDSIALFGPGKVSDEFSNRDMAISPDGTELFYTIQHGNGALSFVMYIKKENNKWTSPEVAFFSGKYNDLEPAFSFDGNKLYFSSNRPLDNKNDSVKDYDIWSVSKSAGKWEAPVNLGRVVNSNKDEFYPSVSRGGNIYFTRDMEKSKEDIVVCYFKNGEYDSAQSLPPAINSAGFEFNAFVSPDEQYIIFSGHNRSDGFGSADLYISKRNKAGEWIKAENLGKKINSAALDYCPFVSSDNKYFFFTSKRSRIKSPMKNKLNFKELKQLLNNSKNGLDDIYWIKRDAAFNLE